MARATRWAKRPDVQPAVLPLVLALGFAAAVVLRVLVGGVGVRQSAVAGLGFAVCLVGLSVAAGWPRTIFTRRIAALGLGGGAVLCLPPLVAHLAGRPRHVPYGNYAAWIIVVVLVAAAEELFLRGAFFAAAAKWQGRLFAILLSAAAFAALHVPLYGWHVVPLDFAVGFGLGVLRVLARSWTAPAIAHIVADVAGWWLR